MLLRDSRLSKSTHNAIDNPSRRRFYLAIRRHVSGHYRPFDAYVSDLIPKLPRDGPNVGGSSLSFEEQENGQPIYPILPIPDDGR